MTRRLKKAAGAKRRIEATRADGNRPLLTYLRGIMASLNATDRLIAECVLDDPERVVTSPIAAIKRSSGASVGSIVGFCRRLGLSGFVEFKIALARDLAQSGLPAAVVELPENGSLLAKVFRFHAQSLAETLRLNSNDTFEETTRLLGAARRIEFFSIGLSYPVAYTASCKFLLIGLPAAAQCDSHMQLINATLLRKGDVAFGVSCSGSTRETVQCLQVARSKGATTICLTNAINSPITAHSDYCLYATPSEVKYFQAPLASRVTQLAVIDALFVGLALERKDQTAERLQESGEELYKRRLE